MLFLLIYNSCNSEIKEGKMDGKKCVFSQSFVFEQVLAWGQSTPGGFGGLVFMVLDFSWTRTI